MQPQKMALVPLEVWEEYESVVDNMRQILEDEALLMEKKYQDTIFRMHKEILTLKKEVVTLQQQCQINNLLH